VEIFLPLTIVYSSISGTFSSFDNCCCGYILNVTGRWFSRKHQDGNLFYEEAP
jgi:hypothetical protein